VAHEAKVTIKRTFVCHKLTLKKKGERKIKDLNPTTFTRLGFGKNFFNAEWETARQHSCGVTKKNVGRGKFSKANLLVEKRRPKGSN